MLGIEDGGDRARSRTAEVRGIEGDGAARKRCEDCGKWRAS